MLTRMVLTVACYEPRMRDDGSGAGMDDDDLPGLAAALAEVGRRVRDVVRAGRVAGDHDVVRFEGGDDVFGVDERADEVLLDGLRALGDRWPGTVVLEGYHDPVPIGGPVDPTGAESPVPGPWRFLADPVDGTRPYLAGKSSAWVLLGAGRDATTLEHLEVGAAVEIPTARAALGLVAWAAGDLLVAEDDDLVGGGDPMPVTLQPQVGRPLDRSFVTVVRLLPGGHGPIGAWADAHLAGLEVYDDLRPCTGGALMGLATGADRAVFDPRPLLHPGGFAAHPYDLAALVVARAAGAVIEALPPGPLDVPLDTGTAVAWAGYADEATAERLRPTDL
jgi:fructose-1,6-bisphosphatase/inositol monophosphatase family enzyme